MLKEEEIETMSEFKKFINLFVKDEFHWPLIRSHTKGLILESRLLGHGDDKTENIIVLTRKGKIREEIWREQQGFCGSFLEREKKKYLTLKRAIRLIKSWGNLSNKDICEFFKVLNEQIITPDLCAWSDNGCYFDIWITEVLEEARK